MHKMELVIRPIAPQMVARTIDRGKEIVIVAEMLYSCSIELLKMNELYSGLLLGKQ